MTASQSITYGTASITLGGTISSGSLHPPAGETVKVTIDGITQTTTTTGTGGTFTLSFTTSAIPASATPYTITYSYGGDSNFGSATNTATTLTVSKATTTFSAVTASQSITVGTASISLGGTLSSGSLHPPAGETVTVTIDSIIAEHHHRNRRHIHVDVHHVRDSGIDDSLHHQLQLRGRHELQYRDQHQHHPDGQ